MCDGERESSLPYRHRCDEDALSKVTRRGVPLLELKVQRSVIEKALDCAILHAQNGLSAPAPRYSFHSQTGVGQTHLQKVVAKYVEYVHPEPLEGHTTIDMDSRGDGGKRMQNPIAHPIWYLVWFIITLSASMVVYFLGNVKSVGSIMCVFAILLALEWVGMYALRIGTIVALGVGGALLYGSVWLLEHGPVGAWLWEQLV